MEYINPTLWWKEHPLKLTPQSEKKKRKKEICGHKSNYVQDKIHNLQGPVQTKNMVQLVKKKKLRISK